MSYKDPERQKAYNKAYNASHRKDMAARRKIYYASHKKEAAVSFRAYYASHKKESAARKRAWKLKVQYGLTPEAFDTLLRDQGGLCAVCRTSNWGHDGPMVDHDHTSGKVRGILCLGCNSAEGHLKSDPVRARALADYMEKEKN